MRTRNERIAGLLLPLLLAMTPRAWAAQKPAIPPGMAEYVMVLWPRGTPIPGDPKGMVSNLPEPDIEKLGGKVLAVVGRGHAHESEEQSH